MRFLFCCEFYQPSVGGVQEVMRQIAERMASRGHDVTVATTRLAERTSTVMNGVRIAEFAISGNAVDGLEGEVERYRKFVADFNGDAILIKAAQQWTFDALWESLDRISARKVFIPCGFPGMGDPRYAGYFSALPAILKKMDHLIFYARKFRDIDFALAHGLTDWSIVPNGASEVEFAATKDAAFRTRLGIPESSFVFLTVGSLTGLKGHAEVAEAFARLDNGDQHVTLILNGSATSRPLVPRQWSRRVFGKLRRAKDVYRLEGLKSALGRAAAQLKNTGIRVKRLLSAWAGQDPVAFWTRQSANDQTKMVLPVNLPRPELVQAFKNADLFVFASNVEYSPLVLYESVAAGTPFLSVPVGNAEEIAKWTGGGLICPAPIDSRGFTRVDPALLAQHMREAMTRRDMLRELGRKGHARWQAEFTWEKIADRYERILSGQMAVDWDISHVA